MHIYLPPDVEFVREMYEPSLHRLVEGITSEQFSRELTDLLEDGFREQYQGSGVELSNNHPIHAGKSVDEILALDLTREDFEVTIDHVIGRGSDNIINPDFERAVNIMLAGDFDEFKNIVNSMPELVRMRSAFKHQATLLHYAGSNGVEIWRQVVPTNLPEIVHFLLDKGADVGAKMMVYNGYYDVITLAESSAHPIDADVRDELLQALSRQL
jgi:hypothetical protein